jgi:hypothetical protein
MINLAAHWKSSLAVSLAAVSLSAALTLPAPAFAQSIGEVEAGRTAAIPAGSRAARAGRSILKECVTSGLTTDSPANAHGAASALRLVAATTNEIGIYNRTDCAILSRVTTAAFFAVGFPGAANDSFAAARVIYDFGSQRFFVSALSIANTNHFLYFAVSTSDTAAAWHFFRIRIISPAGNKCVAPEVTGFSEVSPGVQASRWLLTANISGGNAVIMSLEKQPTLTGSAPKFKCFTIFDTFVAPPIVRGNAAQAHFLHVEVSHIERYPLNVAAGVKNDTMGAASIINIPIWTAPPNAPQPNGQELDTGNGAFRSASIQIGDLLWNVHTINENGQARWRLYKVSAASATPLFVFTPRTFKGIHHNFNPSVATGDADEAALAFITFSRTRPGAVLGRAEMVMGKGPNSSDLGWTFTSIQKSSTQFDFAFGSTPCNSASGNNCRWGNYSATQVDPLNNARAWGFNQLVNGPTQNDWVTRAGHID